MFSEPLIKESTFKADFINSLFLRPVYREPFPGDKPKRAKKTPSGGPLINESTFRADLVNSLLLRPVYREPYSEKEPAATDDK